MDKKNLRKLLTEKRNTLYASENFETYCFHLQNHIINHALFQSTKIICSYAPTKSEIDVNLIAKTAWEQKKTMIYPRCSKAEKGIMNFYQCESFSDLEQGAYNILEPKLSCKLWNENILNSPDTLVLVPALAYSPKGFRLGYGQGFYDRFLAKIPLAASIGITLSTLISEDIIVEPWDRAVQYLATEKDVQKI